MIGNLSESVKTWRVAKCVASSRCSSNPAILFREFLRWSAARCTCDAFVAELDSLGFRLDADGMVAGLILREDFQAACEYERRQLAADASAEE